MLDPGTGVEINKFFNLTLSESGCGLIDWHFDGVVWRSHDNGIESRVCGTDL